MSSTRTRLALLCALLFACSNEETSSTTDVSASSLSLPGGGCVEHADCDSAPGALDGYCYSGAQGAFVFPAEGYCTIDDGTGAVCANDAECPSGSQCVDAGGYKLCLPSCGQGATCPAHQACATSFFGYPLDKASCVPGNGAATDGDACAEFYDCNVDSTCWKDPENPGGNCTSYACTLGTNAGCHGGTCVTFEDGPGTGTVCVESCTLDSHCRTAEGYVCHDPDGAGGVGGYCRHPHNGDACATAADCGGTGWSCLGAEATPAFPGGYCTRTTCPVPGTTEGCGSGAVCAFVAGANSCVDRCPTIGDGATCRTGYTCTSVGATTNGGGCLPTP